MTEVFDNNTKNALKLAHRLGLCGEGELAKRLCVKCAQSAADYSNRDMIALFYGEEAYRKLNDATDAARFIFIAECAKKAYNALCSKGEASSSSAWVKVAINSSQNNDELAAFFYWLSRKREVETDDQKYFRMLIRALNKGAYLYMDLNLRSQKPEQIINKVVSGRISFKDGYLQ